MLITKFTGNVRDFPSVNREEPLNDEPEQSEHNINDRSTQPLDEQRHEGTCLSSSEMLTCTTFLIVLHFAACL